MTQLIGVDVGGTFTDTVVLTGDGRVGIGKALSVPSDIAQGVLDSIAAAAAEVGQSLEEAIAAARLVGHGTTVGVNALLTRTGAPLALLTTRGFEATLPIARANYIRGLDERYRTEARLWDKPPLLLSRRAIRGVDERIDSTGEVLRPLDEAAARDAIRALAAAGARSFAVALLWSVANPVHERRLGELIADEVRGAHVTLSSDLSNRVGEYERTATALLNAYVGPVVSEYLARLEGALRDRGFTGTFFLLQTGGGVQRAAAIARRPIATFNSGPVAGLTAAGRVGERLGHSDVISTDVGGTSFDVGLLVASRMQYARRPMIERWDISIPVVDIMSIGTGGGSIAWFDASLAALRVGPESAGAEPGPACYGRGGTRATVTDAAVVLGYLDRIGGRLELDADAARAAVERDVAGPLGTDVMAAAEGVLRVANAQMADLIRRATVLRGHNPAQFALYAYGGAAPQYAGRYAADLGVPVVVVPAPASVFSAYGAICSDLRTWVEAELPGTPVSASPPAVAPALAELEARALRELDADGAAGGAGGPVLTRFAGLRFRRQVHELQVPITDGDYGADAAAAALKRFRAEYERLVGRGTVAADAVAEVVGVGVEARHPLPFGADLPHRREGRAEPVRTRSAWFEGRSVECPVYDGDSLPTGAGVAGPAFVELPTTTLVVYPGQSAEADAVGNLLLHLGGARA